jgi:hypothetical protein
MKITRYLFLLIPVLFSISCGDTMSSGKDQYYFSFEKDMDGWEAKSTGTVVGSQVIKWSVERSMERAFQDSFSVKLTLDNIGTSGKIWIENSFAAVPGTDYGVTISFQLATSDYGSSNSFTIIAGASDESPMQADELIYWDGTDQKEGSGAGWVWMSKTYRLRVTAGAEGRVFVYIGVWGTWTIKRSYYIDKVKVKIDRLD